MDKTGGCSPLAVSFTNASTGTSSNTVYTWDFGNGNTSTLANPGALYTLEKTYTVTLSIQDGSKTDHITKTITVFKDPVVAFSVSASKACLPAAVTFSANADPGDGSISTYTWDFGDGSTLQTNNSVQSHTYTVPQSVTASLTVTSNYGCHTTLQKPDILRILPSLNAGFSADKKVLCLISDPVQFTNTSAGPGTLSYEWDFGDGNTSTQPDPAYTFNKKGTYSVQLTVNSSEGCTAVARQTDLLNVANYKTDFDAPASACQSSYVSFSSLSSPAPDNSLWEVDGIQIYSYNALTYWFSSPGTHTVKLNNTFGNCQQTATKNIIIKPAPVLNAFDSTPTEQCNQVSYQFKDNTAGAVKWEWDFNHRFDPPQIGSTLQSPSTTYPDNVDGYYPVWLRVTNADGCSSTITQEVQIKGNYLSVQMDGNNNSCAEPVTETFSANTNQVLTGYLWEFGDGQSSIEATPTHTFTDVGRYNVTLNYSTADGCKGSVTNANFVNIFAMPDFDFTASATNVCGPTPIVFTATPNDGTELSWSWDFGDNLPYGPAGSADVHTYDHPGTYTVTLHISAVCGDAVTKENYITVEDLFPKITGFSNTCNGNRGEISFTQTSANTASLVWDFGDGSTLSTSPAQESVKHVYKKTGSYNVVLTASNGQCIQSDRTTVYVLLKQNPVLSASQSIACTSDNVPIQIAGLETNPEAVSYAYPYNVLKLEYADGTPFDGNRYDPYTSWQNIYNGSVNSFKRTDQTFHAIVMSSYFNCPDTSNFVSIKIKGVVPGFQVNANNLCYQSPVILQDTSKTTGDDPILSRVWDFGDGQTATGKQNSTVSHIYQSPGSYLITLQISDAGGCSASTPPYGQRVDVDGPLAAFSASGTAVPLNSSIYFYNNSNTYGSENSIYTWDFGDQTPVSNDLNSIHTYPSAGTYTVKLTATNPGFGCSSTASRQIVVKNFNTAFTFDTTYVSGSCPPVLVSFNNTSVNYSSVSWDFGDGVTAGNLSNPSHIYANPGKYIVTLYGYAPNGLAETHTDSVFIRSPEATVTAAPVELCIGASFTLSAKATNTNTYIWDFGDGSIGSTDTDFSVHTYPGAGTYFPELMIQDAGGCYGKADPGTAVTVRDNPVIQFSPENPLICRGSAVVIHASGGSRYVWSPGNDLSNAAVADPVASPSVSSSYNLQVTDDFGCTNSGAVTVEVVQPGSIHVNPDTAVCAGDPVPLRASGEEVYQWIGTTDGLDNALIPDPIAIPPATLIYTVTGADDHHCFTDTASVHIRVKALPLVNAGPDVELWAGQNTQLTGTASTDVDEWGWIPQNYLSCTVCASPVCAPLANTNYILTVKNQDGCFASDTVLVKIDCEAARVAIPNIFTPNHDGHNDVFMVKGISIIKHLIVFNRWGEPVFERNNFIAGDRSSCWDGSFKGQECPAGSYVYFIEMECPAGGTFSRKGSVVLVR